MSITEKELAITTRAKYYTYGEGGRATRRIWIACHGYGELAAYFIKKFESLNPETDFVIAPQGLSLFYLEGFSGRVGANWMTRHDRELAIANYTAYIEAVCVHEFSQRGLDAAHLPIYGFGFSQGTATVCRWAAITTLPWEGLVLWAGVVPPDMQAMFFEGLQQRDVHLIYGTQDEFVSQKALEAQVLALEKKGITPCVHTYEGAHRIDTNWFENWVRTNL